jgi:putative ABC transport system permease protein
VNVSNRPLRTLLSILMIAVPVTLILTLVGLSNGFIEDSRKRQGGVGADILFKPPGSSPIGFTNASMPGKLVDKLATEPHIVQAMGEVVAPVEGFDAVMGIDSAAFDRMSGGFEFVAGHTFSGPDDMLVDTGYAQQKKVHPGRSLLKWRRCRRWKAESAMSARSSSRWTTPRMWMKW